MLKIKIGGNWGVFGCGGGTTAVSLKFLLVLQPVIGITGDKCHHSPILSLFKRQKMVSLYIPVIERN